MYDPPVSSSRLLHCLDTLTSSRKGTYDFEPGLSALQVLERIYGGVTSPRIVTIPEGRRLEEVAEILAANGVTGRPPIFSPHWRSLRTGVAHWLMTARVTLHSKVIFFQRLTPFPSARLPTRLSARCLNASTKRFRLIASSNSTGRGVACTRFLTLASIVERETVIAEERAVVASVFSNRLGEGIRLESDATVQYAISEIPGSSERFGYWKADLTLVDLAFPSSYNTYFSAGLPPGPIANPGDASIAAAIDPPPSPFFFFVARGDGSHVFAETFDEHLRNAQEFLGWGDRVPIVDVGEEGPDDVGVERTP